MDTLLIIIKINSAIIITHTQYAILRLSAGDAYSGIYWVQVGPLLPDNYNN